MNNFFTILLDKKNNNIAYLLLYILFYFFIFRDTFINQHIFYSDGQLHHFFKDLSLWDSSWGSGYYILADSASYHLYPLRIIFYNLMPNWFGFNLFIISAYLLASFFTFGYIKSITNSNYASFLGGLIFGFGGFMIAHLWHTSMIHTAMWMPLLIWSAENLKNKLSKKWIVLYVISIIMMILAGHLQIFTYSIMLLVLYVIFTGNSAKYGYMKYLYLNIFLIIISVSISIFQLYPTFELAQLGFRKELRFEEFNTYILSFKYLFFIFFPNLFGNNFIGEVKYFGDWNLNELMIYSGISSILIVFYLLSKKLLNDRLVQFWFLISIFSLLLSLGDNIHLLAKISFEIPILNKFRVLARHSMEFTFSIAVLTSMGIVALLNNNIKKEKLYFSFLIIFGFSLFTLLWINYSDIVEIAHNKGILLKPFFTNSSIYYSIILYIISIIGILIILIYKSFFSKVLLLLITILNLGYYSFFYEDKNLSYSKDILSIDNKLKFIQDNTFKNHIRVLELDGLNTPLLNPMFSSIYSLNSAGWYGPLITKDYSNMLSMRNYGYTDNSILLNNTILNMLNIKYIFTNRDYLKNKYSFILGNLSNKILKGEEKILFKENIIADKLKIISNLSNSIQIKQGTKIIDIILSNSKGEKEEIAIYAGIDTSEWASECLDIKPIIEHNLSKIYSSWTQSRKEDNNCQAHLYITSKNIYLKNINRIDFIWNKNIKVGVINIDNLIFMNNKKEREVSLMDRSSLKVKKKIHNISILENINKLEYIRLVNNIHLLNEKEILKIIRKNKNISKVFSSDIDKNYSYNNFDKKYNINIISKVNGNIKFEINSNSGGYLILSESYHKGWKAYIDNIQTKVYKTNNILNGIKVPKGKHIIEFNFLPITLIYSLLFSIVSLFLFFIILYRIK